MPEGKPARILNEILNDLHTLIYAKALEYVPEFAESSSYSRDIPALKHGTKIIIRAVDNETRNLPSMQEALHYIKDLLQSKDVKPAAMEILGGDATNPEYTRFNALLDEARQRLRDMKRHRGSDGPDTPGKS